MVFTPGRFPSIAEIETGNTQVLDEWGVIRSRAHGPDADRFFLEEVFFQTAGFRGIYQVAGMAAVDDGDAGFGIDDVPGHLVDKGFEAMRAFRTEVSTA